MPFLPQTSCELSCSTVLTQTAPGRISLFTVTPVPTGCRSFCQDSLIKSLRIFGATLNNGGSDAYPGRTDTSPALPARMVLPIGSFAGLEALNFLTLGPVVCFLVLYVLTGGLLAAMMLTVMTEATQDKFCRPESFVDKKDNFINQHKNTLWNIQ